jgi:cytochrome d ubiquinol oxidase subunit II
MCDDPGGFSRSPAPDASPCFLFYGGIVVLPVVVYTVGIHWVFRGKVRKA